MMRGYPLECLLLFAVVASPVFGVWKDACRSNEGAKGNLNRIYIRLNNAIKRNNLGKLEKLTNKLSNNPTNLRSQICLIRSHAYMAEINLEGEIKYAQKCGLEKTEKTLNLLKEDLDYFLAVARESDVDEATDDTPELKNQIASMVASIPPMHKTIKKISRVILGMKKNMESRNKQDFCVYHRLLQDSAKNCYREAVNIYTAAVRDETRFVVTTTQKANLGQHIREAEDWRNKMDKNRDSIIKKIRANLADAKAQMPLLGKANYLQALANIRDNCEDLQVNIKNLQHIKECPPDMHLHWYR